MLDVVLANYNHSNSITSAIEALNNQSLRPHRIYIIDDASTDDSWEKLLLASEKYENIVLIRNLINEGANKSYNKGLELCTSELIYFAAADDVTYPELFEKCTKALISNPQAAFASAEVLVFNSENKKFSMRPIIRPRVIGQYIKPECIEDEFKHNDNWIMTGACVFKTDLVRNACGLNSDLGAFSDSFLAKKLAFNHGCIFLKYTGLRWNITKTGYSRSLYTDYEELTKIKTELQLFFLSNKEFPIWYLEKFSKRLAFNEIRLSSLNNKRCFSLIILLIAYLKFRPYSISRILQTYVVRFIEKKVTRYCILKI
jgi:glycosyltransferase involved in cell wall biosynthesis